MSCEYRNCTSTGVIHAHGSVWCKSHIGYINSVRKDIDNAKPIRKSVLEFVNGKLVMVNREESEAVDTFLTKYRSGSCDDITLRSARKVLSNVIEKLRTEVVSRGKELKMRKKVCKDHLHFYRACTGMYKRALIDRSKTELVESVEYARTNVQDESSRENLIDMASRRYDKEVQSHCDDIYRMETDI